MAQDIVSGLFGLSPWQVEQQRNQQVLDFASKSAELAPKGFGQAALFMGQGAGNLARPVAGMMGMVDPAVQEAQQRQQALAGLDVSDPKALLQRALQTQDPQLKMRLVMMARQMDAERMRQRKDDALANAAELRAQRELALAERGPTTPEVTAYEYAKKDGYKGSFEDWMNRKSGEWSDPYSLNGAMVQKNAKTGEIRTAVASRQPAQPQVHYITNDKGEVTAITRSPSGGFTKEDLGLIGKGTKGSADTDFPKEKLDFYAQQYLMGDNTWQVGLGRTAEGTALIKAVKLRAPELAAETGMKPEDIMANRQEFGARAKALKDFATGPQGKQITAFNTVIDHLDTLEELSKALKNKDTQAINYVSNKISAWSGNPEVTNFESAKQIIAEEVVKSIVPGGGGVTERMALAEKISSAKSEEQLLEGIKTFQKLMGGQLRSLQQQYEQTTKRKDFDSKLLPRSKEILASLQSKGSTVKQAAPSSGIKFLGFEPQ